MTQDATSRRGAFVRLGMLTASAPVLHSQETVGNRPVRLVPIEELVNLFEFEEMAKLKLDDETYANVAGSDRRAFDRITFRPRRLVGVEGLDLTTVLFGEQIFAPILVGPIPNARQFHPEGELATVRGAAAARATVVVSNRSSYPIGDIAAQTDATIWYQVDAEGVTSEVRDQIQRAVSAGCSALCITVGSASDRESQPQIARGDWRVIDELRRDVAVPVLLRGVMSREDAREALESGIQGIGVSNGGRSGNLAAIEVLPSIVDVVGGQVPVIVDGSFRRGSDVVKALAFGAQAVMLGRPPVWGLAAYGADGVRAVVEMLQTDVARTMISIGRLTLETLDRDAVRISGPQGF